jgi:hypothetical protein
MKKKKRWVGRGFGGTTCGNEKKKKRKAKEGGKIGAWFQVEGVGDVMG